MVAPRTSCSSVSSWLWKNNHLTYTHPNLSFIGPCHLHYLLFSGIGALLCHHPYCFPSQSQTVFGMGAGRPPLTTIARRLFRRENTSDFAGGRGGGWRRCFKLFLKYTYFSRLVKIIFRILQQFLSHYSFSRYSVTRYSLLCLVTLIIKIQKKVVRVITFSSYSESSKPLF